MDDIIIGAPYTDGINMIIILAQVGVSGKAGGSAPTSTCDSTQQWLLQINGIDATDQSGASGYKCR